VRTTTFALLALTAVSLPLTARLATVEDPKGDASSITIKASPSLLPQGASCTIELAPARAGWTGTVLTTYEGTVKDATAEGVMLTVSQSRSRRLSGTPLDRIPHLNRLTTSVGVGLPSPSRRKDVWIPIEGIKSVTLTSRATP